MKKILHITTHLNSGGICNYVLRLGEPLRERGYEMSVFSSGGECEDQFREQHIALHEADIRTKSEIHPKVFRAAGELAKYIKKEEIALIHAHTRVSQVAAVIAGRRARVPVVTTCHGFYKRRIGRRVFDAWGDKVIAISKPVGDYLRKEYSVPEKRLAVIPNAIDVADMDVRSSTVSREGARHKFGYEDKHYVIGCVARLIHEKGQAELIRAFAALHEKHSQVRLLLAGDGRQREQLENLARDLGVRNEVLFTGNISDVAPAYKALDVFAMPAIWREPFGLNFIEAGTFEKPLIASRRSAIAPEITQYEAGITVAPESIIELKDALERLLNDPEAREKMGHNARKMTLAEFDMPRMADQLAGLYNELLTP